MKIMRSKDLSKSEKRLKAFMVFCTALYSAAGAILVIALIFKHLLCLPSTLLVVASIVMFSVGAISYISSRAIRNRMILLSPILTLQLVFILSAIVLFFIYKEKHLILFGIVEAVLFLITLFFYATAYISKRNKLLYFFSSPICHSKRSRPCNGAFK